MTVTWTPSWTILGTQTSGAQVLQQELQPPQEPQASPPHDEPPQAEPLHDPPQAEPVQPL